MCMCVTASQCVFVCVLTCGLCLHLVQRLERAVVTHLKLLALEQKCPNVFNSLAHCKKSRWCSFTLLVFCVCGGVGGWVLVDLVLGSQFHGLSPFENKMNEQHQQAMQFVSSHILSPQHQSTYFSFDVQTCPIIGNRPPPWYPHPLSPILGNTLKPQNYSFEQYCFQVWNKFCSFSSQLWKHKDKKSSILGFSHVSTCISNHDVQFLSPQAFCNHHQFGCVHACDVFQCLCMLSRGILTGSPWKPLSHGSLSVLVCCLHQLV